MASPIRYPVVDDKDLDDAALWAVIDSAAASAPGSSSSSRSSKFCKPLAIKLPNLQSQSPISNPSPRLLKASFADSDSKVPAEDSWPFRPPRKIPRTSPSENNDSSPLVVYRTAQRSPTNPGYFSPEAYLSPGIKRFSSPEGSPASEEEKSGTTTHSLSGRFPSVSLFKEYQNAAMAVFLFPSICSCGFLLSFSCELFCFGG